MICSGYRRPLPTGLCPFGIVQSRQLHHHGKLLAGLPANRSGCPIGQEPPLCTWARQLHRVALEIPSSSASCAIERLCGDTIFFKTASLRSSAYFIYELNPSIRFH